MTNHRKMCLFSRELFMILRSRVLMTFFRMILGGGKRCFYIIKHLFFNNNQKENGVSKLRNSFFLSVRLATEKELANHHSKNYVV